MGAMKGTLGLTQGVLMPTSTQEAHRQVCVPPAIKVGKGGPAKPPGQGHAPQILTRGCGAWGNVDCIRTGRGRARGGNSITHEGEPGRPSDWRAQPRQGTLNREFGR